MRKTPRGNIILNKCTKKHDNILHCSWDKARDRCNCYFSFWAVFLYNFSYNFFIQNFVQLHRTDYISVTANFKVISSIILVFGMSYTCHCFFRILGGIKMNFGQKLTQLKTNNSNLFLTLLCRLETISWPFHAFNNIT